MDGAHGDVREGVRLELQARHGAEVVVLCVCELVGCEVGLVDGVMGAGGEREVAPGAAALRCLLLGAVRAHCKAIVHVEAL